MKLSFRWYGPQDPVSLHYIRQIPSMHSIVTAVYDVPVGEVWSHESIAALKQQIEDHGLHFDVIESVPVHEDIKLGLPTRDQYIANYCENIRRLSQAGIKVICYNFMPVFDWTRTQLDKRLPDGSTALVYYVDDLKKMDPLTGELSLPGWDSSYKKEDLQRLFDFTKRFDEENSGKTWLISSRPSSLWPKKLASRWPSTRTTHHIQFSACLASSPAKRISTVSQTD